MNIAEKNIINAFTVLLENLSLAGKKELIERIKKSLKTHKTSEKNGLEESFGAWKSSKSPEEIIKEINDELKFEDTKIEF